MLARAARENSANADFRSPVSWSRIPRRNAAAGENAPITLSRKAMCSSIPSKVRGGRMFESVIHGSGDSTCADHALGFPHSFLGQGDHPPEHVAKHGLLADADVR